MVNGHLMIALDFEKKPGDPRGQYSYRTGNTWHVVQYGPGFSNTHRVTEYDDEGLQWLLRIERKEVTDVKDRAVQP